jgi:hypothetical protein
VRVDKKITIEAKEEHSAIVSDMKNTINHFFPKRIGIPVFLSKPPGTVNAAATITVAINVATTMQWFAVFFIQISPSFHKSLCASSNISLGVFPSEFFLFANDRRTIFCISYN